METEEEKQKEESQDIPEIPLANEPVSDDNQPMQRSRIRKHLEKQSKQTIVLTLLGMIMIAALLIFYGPTMIVNFSILLGKLSGKENDVQNTINDVFIAPPVLDPLASATNSAKISVSGAASIGKEGQIKLYINDELADVTNPETNDSFSFDDIALKEGENEIKAIAVVKNQKSKDSNIVEITYLKDPPELQIDEPAEGKSFSGGDSPVAVKGKTNEHVRVTVNGFTAITKSDGSFSYALPLQNGENTIKIVAVDNAGNKTEKEIKVTYSP